jgi:hypothetical protein
VELDQAAVYDDDCVDGPEEDPRRVRLGQPRLVRADGTTSTWMALPFRRDCDDDDASSSSRARVETWYDGVDQDCDGASDYDADRDGTDAAAYGGNRLRRHVRADLPRSRRNPERRIDQGLRRLERRFRGSTRR